MCRSLSNFGEFLFIARYLLFPVVRKGREDFCEDLITLYHTSLYSNVKLTLQT